MNNHQELDLSVLTRDTRSSSARFWARVFRSDNFRNLLLLLIVAQIYMPALWFVWIPTVYILIFCFKDQKFHMPLRIPKDLGGIDRSDYYEELIEESFFWGLIRKSRVFRHLGFAGGILYLGFLRNRHSPDQGTEAWLNKSDCTTHMFVAGTTGSGKTESLIGLFYNSICWGSATSYADGKAQTDLAFSLWSLCRRHGREDDFLVLNFLTGGVDPFTQTTQQHDNRLKQLHQSNSMNPFSEGAADFLLQLMASLLGKATGEGAKWQEKSINMIDAVLRILCYKRSKGELDLSIGVIRHYLALHNLVQLYIEGRDGKLPELAYLPIKAYFETGLPGFNLSLINDISKWDPEVFNQHGYLTGAFSRVLSMMMDTYDFIFADKYPEIDLEDVLLNNRLLVVLIPSLEKSASEAASLGKLYISCIRLMMARNLGYVLEGNKNTVLDTKASNSPYPFILINDELSYYFAEGIAVMFAQARSLNFMMVAAVQDVQGLKRGEAGEESASMLANTKIKWSLALEDPDDTFDLIRKSGGEAYYSILSGYDFSSGTFTSSYEAQASANIQKQDRITLNDLKNLNAGEGMVIFKDAVIPTASFYIPDDQKKTSVLSARINRFLQINRPSVDRLPKNQLRNLEPEKNISRKITIQLSLKKKPYYPTLDDPILLAIQNGAKQLNGIQRFPVSPEERGIVLFELARKAMKNAKAQGRTGYMHEQRNTNPPELIGGE